MEAAGEGDLEFIQRRSQLFSFSFFFSTMHDTHARTHTHRYTRILFFFLFLLFFFLFFFLLLLLLLFVPEVGYRWDTNDDLGHKPRFVAHDTKRHEHTRRRRIVSIAFHSTL